MWLPSMGVWAQRKPSPSNPQPFMPCLHLELPPSAMDDQPCPICLSPIHPAHLAVLCWCMHRFCTHCIQKWSLVKPFCPLCKQTFHGWYFNIRSPSEFDRQAVTSTATPLSSTNHRSGPSGVRRRTERQPTSMSRHNFKRSLPLQWRRSFRFSRKTAPRDLEINAEGRATEEALRWRASIYRKSLRAVPVHVDRRMHVKQAPVSSPERKARIERRLEPWIRRELQALTDDSDPSLLVHFVLSLWIVVLTQREGNEENRSNSNDRFEDAQAVKHLEPFLEERASAFWHELRCFAESPYSLRTYDSVVAYRKVK